MLRSNSKYTVDGKMHVYFTFPIQTKYKGWVEFLFPLSMTSYTVSLPNHHEKLPIFLSVAVHNLYINPETKPLPTVACLPVTAQLIPNTDVQYRCYQNFFRVSSPRT